MSNSSPYHVRTASENPKVEEPVYHFGLSLAEGEHLTREQWENAAARVLDRMGLAEHQVVLIAHNDTDNEHVHIVANRIGDDGRAWRPFRDMVRAHEIIPGIEIEYGLSRTGRDQAPPDLSAGTVREAMRSGVQPLADRVREEAGQAFAEATGWRDLEVRLAALGYRLERAERGSAASRMGASEVVSDAITGRHPCSARRRRRAYRCSPGSRAITVSGEARPSHGSDRGVKKRSA